MACVTLKPVVDGIESEYAGRLLVLRVDVQSSVGKAMGREYNIIATPSFVFFDAKGAVVWRSVGTLQVNQVREALGDQ
jgi:thiol-disulfide isomerase/thioredoxin